MNSQNHLSKPLEEVIRLWCAWQITKIAVAPAVLFAEAVFFGKRASKSVCTSPAKLTNLLPSRNAAMQEQCTRFNISLRIALFLPVLKAWLPGNPVATPWPMRALECTERCCVSSTASDILWHVAGARTSLISKICVCTCSSRQSACSMCRLWHPLWWSVPVWPSPTVSDFSLGGSSLGWLVGAGAVAATAAYQIWAGTKQTELAASSFQLLHQYCPIAGTLLAISRARDGANRADQSHSRHTSWVPVRRPAAT